MKFTKILFLLCPFFVFSQQFKKVDFKTLNANLSLHAGDRKISGTVNYTFDVLSSIDTIRIDAKNMNFSDVKINNKSVEFKKSATELKLFKGYKKEKTHSVLNTKRLQNRRCISLAKATVWKFGHKVKENIQVIGCQVLTM